MRGPEPESRPPRARLGQELVVARSLELDRRQLEVDTGGNPQGATTLTAETIEHAEELLGTANHVFIIGRNPRQPVRAAPLHSFRERLSTALRHAFGSRGSKCPDRCRRWIREPGWATAAVGIGGIVGRLIGSSAVESGGVDPGAVVATGDSVVDAVRFLLSAESGGLGPPPWLFATLGDGGRPSSGSASDR